MKKIALAFTAMFFVASLAFGVYVEIGTGTGNTGYVPTYGFYDYSWSQVIYLQSEIGAAIEINKISYNVQNEPSAYVMPGQKIYMKHTTDATFPDASYDDPTTAGFTLVYDGTVTWNGSGWHDIMLDTPFSYNGTDNLIVYWQNWDGDYASGYPRFYYTSQTNRAKYKYQDSSFPEVTGTLAAYAANIRLHYPYEGPEISLSPSSYDFGMIESGTQASFDLTIYSTGTEDLVITGVDVAAPFSCDYSGGTIPAGGNVVTTVWFEPTEPGEYSGVLTFTIEGDFAGDNTVDLTGNAYPSGYVFESFEGDIFPPFAWDVQNVVGNDWQLYSYGSPPDGEQHARLYYVSGTGSQSRLVTPKLLPLESGDFTKFMARYYSAGTLTIQYSTDKETWTDLETVPITTTYAEYTVDLSSLADGESYYLGFYGETGTSYSYMYLDAVYIPEIEPYSVISLSETEIDFGSHLPGTVVPDREFAVTNNGIGDLTISGITVESPFSADYSGVLAPGESADILVSFDASTIGIYVDTLIVESDADYGEGELVLSGAVYEPLTELDESFEGDFPPLYWTNDGWEQSTFGSPHSGEEFAYSDGSGDTLITPYFTVPTDPYNFTFWYCAESSTYPQELLLNIYVEDRGKGWTQVDSIYFDTEDYQKAAISLVDYAGETTRVMFDHSYSGSDYYGMCLDDVALEPMAPNMVLSDTTHDFDMIEAETVATFDVTIYNNGGMDLEVYGATVNPPFFCDYTGTIPFGGSDIATITFAPTAAGIYSDSLIFHTNATQTDSIITLTGMAYGSDWAVEGFEDDIFPPAGWYNPDGYWSRLVSDDAFAGEAFARVAWNHAQDASLISPRLIVEDGDFISFWWRNDNLYQDKGEKVEGADTLFVEITNTYQQPEPEWELLAALSAPEPMDEYENVVIPLPDGYEGNNTRIRWRHRSYEMAESRGVGLDEIMLPPTFIPVNFYIEPVAQSDYDAAGESVEYEINVHNTGLQQDRYYASQIASRGFSKDLEDFEDDDGGYVGTGQWQWGSPTSGPGNAHSGVNVWATNLSGDYNANSNYTLDTPEITIGTDSPTLTFWHWYDTENGFDGGNVKISTDGGATWALITPEGGYPGTPYSSNPLYPDPIFTGHGQQYWEQETFDLSAYAGQSAIFRWHFGSDSSVQYPGWYIDDVDITTAGGPTPPPPEGWPVTISPDYIDVNPDEVGTFTVTVEIPEDTEEDEGNVTLVEVESRDDPSLTKTASITTTCHPKDPYEPNDTFADATPIAYGDSTIGAQIYYNPDYAEYDLDIYTFDGLEGDVARFTFDIPEDETEFDAAIAIYDADTLLAGADKYWGGHDEVLEYRLLADGTYYIVVGHYSYVLEGPFKKGLDRSETTTYYTGRLELIPSPAIAVEPEELTMGQIPGKVSDEMYISHIGEEGAINLDWNIEVVIPGVEVFLEEGFETFPPDGWTTEGGTNWQGSNSSNAGGTPPEARFNWSPSTTGLQRLITAPINTSGYEALTLEFLHYVNDYSGGYTLGVATTSDGGTTWNDVWTISPTANIGPEAMSIVIDNADMGSENLQICWYFDGNSYNINYWYLDDVKIVSGTKWADVQPSSGSTPQGVTSTVTVTCDPAGLDPGTYTADIIVHNNAELWGASDITVPLTFNYNQAGGGLQGTVTYLDEPVDSVFVKAGNYTTYTNDNGFYQFTEIASGMYSMYFYKDGFLPEWRDSIIVSPNFTTVVDVELTFNGPAPRNLVAEGGHLCIDLDWDPPAMDGGGEEVQYIFDDGTYENGWTGNPGYELWLGNLFPVEDTGELISFELHSSYNSSAGLPELEIDIFDSDHNYVGSTGSFVLPGNDDWITVEAPNIPFDGEFYAMVHYNNETSQAHWFDFDTNGPNATANLDWYYNGSTWDLLHSVAASDPGVFLMRATALVGGKVETFVTGTVDYNQEEAILIKGNSRLQPKTTALSLTPATPSNNCSYSNVPTPYTGIAHTRAGKFELLGYNVYRLDVSEEDPIAFVEETEYRDEIVAVGTEYTYFVTAVYDEGESGRSNEASAVPYIGGGYHEPFDEDWHNTGWTLDPTAPNNWTWEPGYARLKWSPTVTNYDMSLISPELVLPDDPDAIFDLTINMYIDDYSTDTGEVMEIWVIHGSEETEIFHWDLNEHDDWGVSGGQDFVYTDTGQFAGETVQLKFRSHGGSTYNFNYWYVYDILWEWAGIPPEYGALQGTVTDASDGTPIEGAEIYAIGQLHPSGRYTVVTDDNGYYKINPIIAQDYAITCTAPTYQPHTDSITVAPNDTLVYDIELGSAIMDVQPQTVEASMLSGVEHMEVATLTVSNTGTADLYWYGDVVMGDKQQISIPPSDGNFPRDKESISIGPAPEPAPQPGISGDETLEILRGSTAWADDLFNDLLVTFDTEAPGTNLTSIPVAWSGYAGDFGANDETILYIVNSGTGALQAVDVETGAVIETIGYPSVGGLTITGMACDKSTGDMYLSATDVSQSKIYTLDLDTGVATAIGTVTGVPGLIDIAIDGNGQMYGYCIVNDASYKIDKETGAATYLGSIGFNANYAQGMSWAPEEDIIYLAAYDATAGGQLRVLDTQTGATSPVGAFPGAAEYDILAFPGGGVPGGITIEPEEGVVPAGGSMEVSIYGNSVDVPEGTDLLADIFFYNEYDLENPIVVDVTVHVGFFESGFIAGTVTDMNTTNPLEGVLVTAQSASGPAWADTTDATGYYEIEVTTSEYVGLYTVTFEKEGYNPGVVEDVEVTANETTPVDYDLTSPILVYEPETLYVQAYQGETASVSFTIGNDGSGPVDFVIDHVYTSHPEEPGSKQISILCVDRDGSSNTEYTDDWPYIQAALDQLGYAYDYIEVDIEGDGPDLDTMLGYDMILWFTGEVWGYYGDDCMTPTDEDNLAAYLDAGGALLLSAHDYLYASYPSAGNLNPGQFPYDYLGIDSVVQDKWTIGTSQGGPPYATIEGVSGSFADGLSFQVQDIYSAKDGLYIDWITAHHATDLFNLTDPTPAGICAVQYEGATFRTAFTTASLAAIVETADLVDVLEGAIGWLTSGIAPWIISIDPETGSIDPEGSQEVVINVSAEELTIDGDYYADIIVYSDPDVGPDTLTLQFHVGPIVVSQEQPPAFTTLESNFPNPFSHSTTFKFALKDPVHVELAVYNIRGQRVATVVNEEKEPGWYEIQWTPTDGHHKLANGIYFYRLKAGDKTFVKKMMIMR